VAGTTNDDLENMDYLQLCEWGNNLTDEDKELLEAYIEYQQGAPELWEALENAPVIITILWWHTMNRSTRGKTESTGFPQGTTIRLNYDMLHGNTKQTTKTLAHESFHALADLSGFTDVTRLEEAYAHSIGLAVENKIWKFPLNGWFCFIDDLRPDSSDLNTKDYIEGWWLWVPLYPSYAKLGTEPHNKELLKSLFVQYYPK
jgi:hypothetical protein